MRIRASELVVLSMVAIGAIFIGTGHTPLASAQDRDRGGGSGRIVPPGERPGGNGWSLGATVDTLDTGVRIRGITPNSAAQWAGLEGDDTIVTVEGYQVGRVGGRNYPLEEELNRRADSSGHVRLLVQNRRNNRLVNMDVRLDRGSNRPGRDGEITGDVNYRSPTPLPAGTELQLRLIHRRLIGKETIVERTVAIRGNPPHRFEFRYPMDKVDAKGTYELEADIVSGGRRVFSEEGTYRIRPADSPARVNLSMRRE